MKRSFIMSIIIFLFLFGCESMKESAEPTPEPTDLPTPLLTPVPSPSLPPSPNDSGKVWFVPGIIEVKVRKLFSTEIHADTGTQRLAAYGFEIKYDTKKIEINTAMGIWGVKPGKSGFISAANVITPGTLIVAGFDAWGREPGTDLHLLTLFWQAQVFPGVTNITLHIDFKVWFLS